jgi:L-asparaginase II
MMAKAACELRALEQAAALFTAASPNLASQLALCNFWGEGSKSSVANGPPIDSFVYARMASLNQVTKCEGKCDKRVRLSFLGMSYYNTKFYEVIMFKQ